MVYTNVNSSFPSQVVPDAEKNTLDYGYQVGRAIENEWFRGDRGLGAGGRFGNNWQDFHRLRLYARGEQSVAKYKDELSINGDLSYLNLDWKPVAVLSKFIDIVVNGMTDKGYQIKSFATDPYSTKERTAHATGLAEDAFAGNLIKEAKASFNIDLQRSNVPEDQLPKSKEELELHMQLSYKQAVEIAEEELINNVFNYNKYEEIKKRLAYDLVVLGISCVKTDFNLANGVTVNYVDPANLVYSYTEDPNFEDVYYVGEVKSVSLEEVKKQFPYLSDAELEEIQKYPGDSNYTRNYWGQDDNYNNVQVLYFEYKTYNNQVFKIKQTEQGLLKALEKPGDFNPPINDNFERVHRAIEVLYSGAKILGHEKMLKWELAENMTRPYSDQTKVQMNYSISAPRMYKGRIESLVSKCIGFADMIQLTHLKIQQVLARMVPDGVFVDVDGLAEVDLGNGTNYNPQEALNMYFQTGSIVGRSKTVDGDINPGKVPIQELQTSNGQAKIGALVQTYQYYLQMIRDVTGLNEARDGSQPTKDALVGLQKLAAAASNTATKHILQSLMYLTVRTAENISLRAADMLNFPLTKNALMNSISTFNTSTLEQMHNLNMHEFGIFLELEPEEEDKQMLQKNIQIALQSGGVDLEDIIDIEQISNIKLANQMLKIKRKQKQERDQAAAQANIQAQAQANAQANEQAALAEMQKQQALTETKLQLEQGKSQFEIQRMQTEAEIKKQLMAEEFNYNIQLAEAKARVEREREKEIENRKDERARIIGTQQSEMISQRQNDELPKNFESAGNDSLGGFGLEQFEPR
ncbi:MAG: hypothetical protein GY787_16660 [Alteromonadales bacterium]|jgi:hypothetical protein|nr:hypothetical protein [Alteromonadales bacterium]